MKNTKKGFTLVELLVVIAILAILATVAVVGYTSFIEKAEKSADEQAVVQMNKILEADEVLNGKPESAAAALKILVENGYNEAMVTYYSAYTLAWIKADNRIVLVEGDKVVYPEAYAGKTEFDRFLAVEKDPAKIQDAIANLKDGEVLIIADDMAATSTVDFTFADAGVYTLDLNNKELTSEYPILEDSTTGGQFKNVTKVEAGNVTFANGTIKADGDATNTCLYVTNLANVNVNNMIIDNTAANGTTCLLADYCTGVLTISNSVINGSGNVIQAYESTVILNNVTATSSNASTSDYLNSAIGLGADATPKVSSSASVIVNGGTYTGKYFVSTFGGNHTHNLTINSGTFNGGIHPSAKLNLVIYGGTFNVDVNDTTSIDMIKDAVQSGCTITINGDTYTK